MSIKGHRTAGLNRLGPTRWQWRAANRHVAVPTQQQISMQYAKRLKIGRSSCRLPNDHPVIQLQAVRSKLRSWQGSHQSKRPVTLPGSKQK